MATLIPSVVVAGEMVKLLQNKSDFPRGVTSLTNIQRQFFDSFVGQTFQVVPPPDPLRIPTWILPVSQINCRIFLENIS